MSLSTVKPEDTAKPEGCLHTGEVVDLTHTPEAAGAMTTTLVQTDDLQVTRLVVAAGQELPPQRTVGDVTLQCLEGRIRITIVDDAHPENDETRELGPGQL